MIYRTFDGRWEDCVEISEEFRLYHNLYYRKNEYKNEYGKYICCYEYIRLLDSGEEDVVIKIEKGNNNLKVEIKVYYLRDFLAAKSMVLIRFHDHRRFSDIDLTDVGSDTLVDKKIGDTFCYSVTINPNKEILGKCFSRFLGKDILPPFKEPKHKDYMSLKGETQKEYVEFIIGIDEEGDPIEHTCNPDELNSKYLTPVFFKREVLKKYYDNTSKYSVEHNYIRCGYLWSISYGINDCGLVHVWLGDLGRLPYNEQLHWKQYNVPPEGNISESTIRRDLMAEPTEPDDIVDIFKNTFKNFNDFWKAKFGWYLFLPLKEEDTHYLKNLHVPTSEEPLEFEQQILALSKILQESINIPELRKLIGGSKEKGINLLRDVLISYFGVDKSHAEDIVKPLRVVQEIRSSGVAHRKGDGYGKICKKLELDKKSNAKFFEECLKEIIKMFEQLQELLNNK